MAGAGSGKTTTLVERALDCLLTERPLPAISDFLIVTFTEAAAAELRQRLRARLEAQDRLSGDTRWAEQLALFDTAHIGTIHSFCFQLIGQYFPRLELDPQLKVLPEAEARLLAEETLGTVLENQFDTASGEPEALQQLLQVQAAGRDRTLRNLVLKVYRYTQSLPNPDAWFHQQLRVFEQPTPEVWQGWLAEAFVFWQQHWMEPLSRATVRGNELAKQSLALLQETRPRPTREQIAAVVGRVWEFGRNPPRGKKGVWVDPLKSFWADAGFLASLAGADSKDDPLAEDWTWCRHHVLALLRLVRAFGEAYATAKRERGELDFADLEQFALRLLWDFEQDRPSAIAAEQRAKLRFVFVDEYQDINAAQDRIITALSRDGAEANRFLVGDVKQSIYRFRLADPRIFRDYAARWRGGREGQTIALAENFRSREAILDFVNAVFRSLMQPEVGGLAYGDDASLRFGAPEERCILGRDAKTAPRVELHLCVKQRRDLGRAAADLLDLSDTSNAGSDALSELQGAEKEARLVALRLKQLVEARQEIWDDQAKTFRPVQYGDMAVLLRAPSSKAESYARQFERAGVPLQVVRGGFFDSLEINDLLNLLHLLDNPLQDLPTLAVLRSPLVGLTLDEFAVIRLALPKGHFWTALARWNELQGPQSAVRIPKPAANGLRGVSLVEPQTGMGSPLDATRATQHAALARKVSTFLTCYHRWRQLARQGSLSRCLDAVFTETHYADWLLAQPRGAQRRANVERLLTLAQQFDQFHRQGLFRFLRFIEAQRDAEAEPEVAQVADENVVRLMSIHQSKGLEFPVVVLGDLGKRFNDQDLRADLILDEQYGLCPCIRPPGTGRKYPSLAHWLASRRQRRELLGEELRLLYVAMTRARDSLLLAGSVPESWLGDEAGELGVTEILEGRSYLDWLWPWFAANGGLADAAPATGQNALFAWQFHTDESLRDDAPTEFAPSPSQGDQSRLTSAATDSEKLWARAGQLAAWQYARVAATREPAKTSVTALRRRFAEAEETTDAFPLPAGPPQPQQRRVRREGRLSAAETGTAHHRFLQCVALERTVSAVELETEAQRLVQTGKLSAEEAAVLDCAALAGFWNSSVGQRIRAQAPFVRRELGFTARFSPDEFRQVIGAAPAPELANECVVVQGVADLVVLLPDELWLLDFKTDVLGAGDLAERVKTYEPQLRLYALALERIFGRRATNLWLHFLATGKTVVISRDAAAS